MLDFDASKLLIIGVVALVVIGPKDLPRVLRQVGQMVSKLRRMAGEFQGQFMDAMKEADLQDLRQEVSKLKETASLDVNFNPLRDIKTELTKAIERTEPTKSIEAGPTSPAGLVETLGPAHHDGFSLAAPLSDTPAEPLVISPVSASADPAVLPDALVLQPAEPANHTGASLAGAVDAVSPSEPGSSKRRRILVTRRRPPGDRVGVPRADPIPDARTGSFLPPRRGPQS